MPQDDLRITGAQYAPASLKRAPAGCRRISDPRITGAQYAPASLKLVSLLDLQGCFLALPGHNMLRPH